MARKQAAKNNRQPNTATTTHPSFSHWHYALGLSAVLFGAGFRLLQSGGDAASKKLNPDVAKCWHDFDRERAAIEDAVVIGDEPVLSWAQRHGAIVRGSQLQRITKGIGGLKLATNKTRSKIKRSDTIVDIPAALALFVQPTTALHDSWDLSCFQFEDTYENNIAGLVLTLLAQKRLGGNSSWAPYLDTLPTYQDFSLNTLLSPAEELKRFEGLDVAEYAMQHQEDVRHMYSRLASRSSTCLSEAVHLTSYKDYLWARLVVETRSVQQTICGNKVAALVPVFDFINSGKPSNYNVKLHAKAIRADRAPTFSVSALSDIANGDELIVHYKEAANDELAASWGFILEGNPIPMDKLPEYTCSQLRDAVCLVPGCLFASLRDEACAWSTPARSGSK